MLECIICGSKDNLDPYVFNQNYTSSKIEGFFRVITRGINIMIVPICLNCGLNPKTKPNRRLTFSRTHEPLVKVESGRTIHYLDWITTVIYSKEIQKYHSLPEKIPSEELKD